MISWSGWTVDVKRVGKPMLTAILAAILTLPTQTIPPTPSLPSLRQIRGPALRKLIEGSKVAFGIHPNATLEIYEVGGKVRVFQGSFMSKGVFEFNDDSVCTVTPRVICRKVFYGRDGRYYYLSSTDSLRRPWRIEIERPTTTAL